MLNGKRIVPGQANNSFAFPAIALAVLCMRPYLIPDDVYLVAAKKLADYPVENYTNTDMLYPSITEACDVALNIAVQVAQYFIENDLANVHPIPDNVCEFIRAHQYTTDYRSSVANTWKYPKTCSLPLPKVPEKDPESTATQNSKSTAQK